MASGTTQSHQRAEAVRSSYFLTVPCHHRPNGRFRVGLGQRTRAGTDRVALPGQSMMVEVDPTRLEQVFGNLLTNAAKYTAAGGRIWLTAETEGEHFLVRVRDTGEGI